MAPSSCMYIAMGNRRAWKQDGAILIIEDPTTAQIVINLKNLTLWPMYQKLVVNCLSKSKINKLLSEQGCPAPAIRGWACCCM